MDYKKWNKERMGRRIASARIRADLSQRDLAGLMGIKQSEIGYYETGKRTPDEKRLNSLAEVLKVSKDWILYGDTGNYEITKTDYGKEVVVQHVNGKGKKQTDKEVVKLLGTLSTEDRILIQNMIKALNLDGHPEKLKELVDSEIKDFKKESRKRKYRLNTEITKRLDSLKLVYPDLWERLINAYKTSDDAKTFVETQDQIFDEAQIRTWTKHPDLYKQFKENIIPNPKTADEEKFNKMYIGTKIVPELIARETKKTKKKKKK